MVFFLLQLGEKKRGGSLTLFTSQVGEQAGGIFTGCGQSSGKGPRHRVQRSGVDSQLYQCLAI